MSTPVFKGVATALITPFTDEGIDYASFCRLIEEQLTNGIDALVVCGTTGEASTMSDEERKSVVEFVIKQVHGRVPVIAGCGSNNTSHACELAAHACAVGADALLAVTPYYNKSTQKGLIEHFSYVADRIDIPMIVYNVPGRTGIGVTAETCRALSQHPNINGIKEASGDIALAAKIRSLCGNDLYIWSGNDDCTVPLMSLGALGVISVASNIVPGTVAKLCTLCLNGSFAEATELYAKYAGLFSTLFVETNPIPVKAAMKLMGMDSGILRLPLTDISPETLIRLTEEMRGVGISV